MASNNNTTWLSVGRVCAELGVSRSTFDKWRAKGVAPVARKLPNGQLRITAADLQAWLDNLVEVA